MQDLRITIIQANLHWENIEANLNMFSEKISAIKEETDLIILPEMFSTGFTMNNKPLAEKISAQVNINIEFGLADYRYTMFELQNLNIFAF